MAFLDESGLQRFWENIVSKFVKKVDGKDLSTNDFTDEEKEKLANNVLIKQEQILTNDEIEQVRINLKTVGKSAELDGEP